MKLFQCREEKGRKTYRILGIIKFSVRTTKQYITQLEKEIHMLRNIMDYCIDIKKIPPAEGEMRAI